MSDSDEDFTDHNMFQNTLLRGHGSFMNNRFKNTASSTYNLMSTENNINGYGYQRSNYHKRATSPMSVQSIPVMSTENNIRGYGYQRTNYHRRETSPMSMQSVPVFGQHNFDNSHFLRERTCETSVINGRTQSAGSVGSMDSTTSAAYAAQIIKNMKFSREGDRIITEACKHYFRNRRRRRVGKRRKLKLYLQHNRRKSEDSGDEGSNSSISSDDDRSVRSTIRKENVLRPNRTMISNFRTTMTESDIYKDCTENFKHSTLKNILNGHNRNLSIQDKTNTRTKRKKECNTINTHTQNTVQENNNGIIGTQKERFSKGFILPSQRFNKSIVTPITNRSIMPPITEVCLSPDAKSDDNENEHIFPNQTVRENTTICQKRTLVNHNTIFSGEKRNKLTCDNSNTSKDDLTFKKPQIPIKRQIITKPNFLSGQSIFKSLHPLPYSYRKMNEFRNTRNNIQTRAVKNSRQVDTDIDKDEILTNPIEATDKNYNNIISSKKNIAKKKSSPLQEKLDHIDISTEKLISKSLQPLIGNIESIHGYSVPINNKPQVDNKLQDVNTFEMPLSTSDVTMKPSFIKRKLFTQNLDIAEDKDASVDSLSTNSPQTRRNYRFRDKKKIRKLATSQSCLSHDVVDKENILELIHKIVPADQINMTSASNERTRKSNPNNEDKWDVASVISMCDNTNVSDTFTDEDIFQVNKVNNKNKKKGNFKKVVEKQKCDVEQMQQEAINKIQSKPKGTTKRTIKSHVRSFWGTDLETDAEDQVQTPLKALANTLGHIKETEAPKYYENISTFKDTTLCSIRNRTNNTFLKEIPPKVADADIEASTLTNDKNVTGNSKIRPRRRTTQKAMSVTCTKSLDTKEVINIPCDPKLLDENEKSNIKIQNNLKSVEAKASNKKIQNSVKSLKMKEDNKTTKINPKLSNKNDIKKPNNNKQPIQEENKTETKTQRKVAHGLKGVEVSLTSFLNNTLNSSTSEHSILTRSLSLKYKQQLFNEIAMNETKSTPKPKPKSTIKNTLKETPKIKKKSSKNKATKTDTKNTRATKTDTKNTRTTPPRKAKENFFESIICTRNRSLNTSLRVQQINAKRTK